MRVNNISNNTYKPNFGVVIPKAFRSVLADNIQTMYETKKLSKTQGLEYAKKVAQKIKEVETWDADASPERLLNYQMPIVFTHVKKQYEHLVKPFVRKSNYPAKYFYETYSSGEIMLATDSSFLALSPTNEQSLVKIPRNKNLVDVFLKLTKEKYLDARKLVVNAFLAEPIRSHRGIEIRKKTYADVKEAAQTMGCDTGKLLMDTFLKKHPEISIELEEDLLKLKGIHQKTKQLFPEDICFR